MIIFLKPNAGDLKITPVTVIDTARTDETYSDKEIYKIAEEYFGKFRGKGIPEAAKLDTEQKIFSLGYDAEYKHDGINLANSMKARFSATITNPDAELVTLLRIEQYSTEQNAEALKKVVNAVIDSQVAFPMGVFVFRSGKDIISRGFCAYSVKPTVTNNGSEIILTVAGAEFSDVVMQLQMAVQLSAAADAKTIAEQLKEYETQFKFKVAFKSGGDVKPVVSKFYPASPLNSVLAQICQDNKLSYTNNNGVLEFYSTAPNGAPKSDIKYTFSMYATKGDMICTVPNLSDYVTAEWMTPLHDPELFSRVAIYNDTGNKNLFLNLAKEPGEENLFAFYVLSYTIKDGRSGAHVKYTGTNNWILSIAKLDVLFENRIYQAFGSKNS